MLQKENRLLRVGVVGARVGEHHVSNCPHFLSCSASGGVASAVPIRGSVEKFEVSSSVQPSGTECEVTTPHLSFTIRQLFEGLAICSRLLRFAVTLARVGEHRASNSPHSESCSAFAEIASAIPIRGSLWTSLKEAAVLNHLEGKLRSPRTPHPSQFHNPTTFSGLEGCSNL